MSKKRSANIIMVAIIAVIVIGGVLVAGHIRGWFDKTPEAAVLTGFRGIVYVERDGVSFAVQEETALRKGDKVSCNPDATVKIDAVESSLVIGEGARIVVEDPSKKSFSCSIETGEVFADAGGSGIKVSTGGGRTVSLVKAVVAFSVRTGAESISVYSGEADGVTAGNTKEWVGTQEYVHELDINSLNDFNIAQIRAAGDDSGLCFAAADIDALEERRQAEIEEARRQAEAEQKAAEEAAREAEEAARKAEEEQKAAEAAAKAKEEAEKMAAEEAAAKAKAEADKKAAEEAAAKAEADKKAAEEAAAKAQSEADKKAAEEAAAKAEAEKKAAEEAAAKAEAERKAAEEEAARKASEEEAARKAAEEEAARKAEEERKAKEEEERRKAEEEAKKTYCYISIRCDTILNNMDDLDPAKAPYVPANGWILGKKKVEFTDGETVFDVLKRVCNTYGIQLEYSWTPMYGSYYIEGIHHLYEFDCGPESGWMYKVNGWFPNYGCSSYNLKKDDDIVWCYTCKGLGADVGGSVN